MAVVNDLAAWQKAAEEQAKKYSDEIKTNNQYLLDQLTESKNNTLQQLQDQQNNSIYNINSNKSEINKIAEDNAKQLNINRLLSLKGNEQAMNRAGLGTQGMVGSQVNSINNNYGTNLTSVLNQKTNDLRELEKEKNDTLLQYNTNRLNLENEYGNNMANLRAQIDDKALNQYNSVYNNYLAMKQQEYNNAKQEEAAAEAKRQWQAEYNLAKKSSYSGGSSNGGYLFNGNPIEQEEKDANGNSLETQQLPDFLFQDEAGQREKHPRYVNNYPVSSVGLIKNIAPEVAGVYGISGNQNVWKANGEYYVWLPNSDKTGGVYRSISKFVGNSKTSSNKTITSNPTISANNKTKLNTTIIKNGIEYTTYKDEDGYYYGDRFSNTLYKITDASLIDVLKKNRKACYTIR